MKPMKVLHNLDKESINNICRLRYGVSVLKDTVNNKETNCTDVRNILAFINSLEPYKCTGKFIRRVFNKYHILSFDKFANEMHHLAKQFPVHTMPLNYLVRSANGYSMLIVHFCKQKRSRLPSPIIIKHDISKSIGLKIANDFMTLIRAKVPKYYLKHYEPYL